MHLLPDKACFSDRPGGYIIRRYQRTGDPSMIQGDHEDAPGQLELNWTFDDVLRNADRLTTYRQICAQVAREHGIFACFMEPEEAAAVWLDENRDIVDPWVAACES